MYSILVVDDFALDRREISDTLRTFADLPLVVVGECENGYAALETVSNLHPDLLICDVEMPGMSGIELAGLLRSRGEAVRILFCSLYDRVHYLHSAIQLNCDGYLMKPLNAGELHDCLRQVLTRMLDVSRQKEQYEALRRAMQEHHEALMRQFFSDVLLGGEQSSENMKQRMRALGISDDATFRVALVEVNRGSVLTSQLDMGDEGLVPYRAFLTLKTGSFAPQPFYAVHINERLYALVAPFEGSLRAAQTRQITAETLTTFVEEMRASGISVSCAFGRQVSDPRDMRAQAQLCRYWLDHRWQYSGDSVIFADDPAQQAEEPMPEVGELQISVRRLLEMETEDISGDAQAFAQTVLAGRSAPLQRLILSYVQANVRYVLEAHEIQSEAETKRQGSEERDCEARIRSLIVSAYETLHSSAGDRPENLIDAVRLFIRESDLREIQLNLVAQHFAYSPNYLNHVFKTATGQTILDYITFCRISRAKELMQDTRQNLSLEEIAGQIGYSHATYLSIVFKKQVGMTPKQYMLKVRK